MSRLKQEVVSPERVEIERQAEYFELCMTRRNRISVIAGWTVVTVVLSVLAMLLGGCESIKAMNRDEMRRAIDGSCVLVTYSGGEVDKVIPGLACPDAAPAEVAP